MHSAFRRLSETLWTQESTSTPYICHILAVYASHYLIKPVSDELVTFNRHLDKALSYSMAPCSTVALVNLKLYIAINRNDNEEAYSKSVSQCMPMLQRVLSCSSTGDTEDNSLESIAALSTLKVIYS